MSKPKATPRPKLTEAEWRELIKPLVKAMHAERLWKISVRKDGGSVDLVRWPLSDQGDAP